MGLLFFILQLFYEKSLNFNLASVIYKHKKKINKFDINREEHEMAIYKNFGQLNKGSEAERLYNLSFDACIEEIHRMDTHVKAEIAFEVKGILTELYGNANRYGNPNLSGDEQIPYAVFMNIMGKIKRYEIVLGWLYEIDKAMDIMILNEKIAEAQEKLDEAIKSQDKEAFEVSSKALLKLKETKENGGTPQDIITRAQELMNSYWNI